ncbi:MFS transporter [Ornithinimicrobium humiphilum]|uniref:DHA2 family multidrug resistance protein-like MFS transporter n=1 Tax=Ornithinimicrobium humiphilum TaxID=125288 RepID=A0A543KRW4_9MICO|nr:MFS transporter [Ornithinimicrobium humiphilum]TQM97790.1 DHA2 family multidrug resistance protein-like MFS transporter [Ornithinimicrobium humiphilum]
MSPLRRWSALAVLVLPVLLISIDMSVLGVAVPALSADLRPSASQLLWIIDIYSFLLAGLLVLMGSLGDRFGRRRLLLIGAPAFGLASVLAAFSTTPAMLLAARALLGLGGATLMPSTLGLLRTIFPARRERQLAVAVWAAAFSAGAALGPVLGGLLLEHFWWGSVFLVNAPVMVVLVVAAALLLPESRDPDPAPFDLPSAALVIAGLLLVVYALKTGVRHPDLTAALAFVVGAAVLAAFVRRQRRHPHPMIDLALFTRPGFSAAVLVNVLAIFGLLGMMFYLPQWLLLVRGLGPALTGWWLLPLAVATIVGSLLSPFVARVVPVRWVVVTGLLLLAVGYVAATRLGTGAGMGAFLAASLLVGLGAGLAETLTNDVVLTTAPPARAGAASAISETGYEFGGAMGTAVLGTLGMAVYASRLRDVEGVPADDLEAGRQTLGAAHEIAAGLPQGAGEALREASSLAFASGISVVSWVCAAAMLLAVVIAWRGLGGRVVDGADEVASVPEGAGV